MLDKILPKPITNRYQGRAIAKWVFALLTLVTLARSLVHMFAADGGAQSIASIPLDAYPPAAADAVVLIFAFWGLSQLMIGLVYLIVLWRYQSLIPLMYLSIIFEYGMRFVLGHMKAIETTATAPGEIGNYVFVPLALLMLILSFNSRQQKT